MKGNSPRGHHYSPSSYLEGWSDAEGYVNFELLEQRKNLRQLPENFAKKRDLYSYQSSNEEVRHDIEKKFNALLDDHGIRVVKILRNAKFSQLVGESLLDAEDRVRLMIYLNSFTFRHPESVASMKEKGASALKVLATELEAEHMNTPARISSADIVAYMEKICGGALSNFGLERYPKLVLRPELLERFRSLNWVIRKSDETTKFRLLTSDMPLVRHSDLFFNDVLLYFPIGPNAALLAAENKKKLEEIIRLPDEKFIYSANKLVKEQAKIFIAGFG